MTVLVHKPRINCSLVSLKIVIFFVISGITALHILHATKPLTLGLNFEEYRCISILAPLISILGPLIAGPLADRLAAKNANNFGHVLRILIAVFLLLTAFIYAFLFVIPPVQREETRQSAVNFGCDGNGAFIFQERCFDNAPCYHWGQKTGSLKLTNCVYTCQGTVQYENMYTPRMVHIPISAPSTEHSAEFEYDDDSAVGVTESLRARRAAALESAASISSEYGGEQISGEEYIGHGAKRVERGVKRQNPYQAQQLKKTYVEPPHLCITEKTVAGEIIVKHCHVYTHDTHHIVVNAVMHAATNNDNKTQCNDWCNYPLDNFQCQVPAVQANYILQLKTGSECRPIIQCQVIDAYESKDSLLLDSKCVNITGDLDTTLHGYLAIRLLGDIFPMAVLTLLNTAIVIAVRETSEGRGALCRQYAWGGVGYVFLFAPLDLLYFNKDIAQDSEFAALVIVILCFIVAAIVLLCSSQMPLSPPEWWWHTKTGVLVYPMSAVRRYGPEILLVTVVAILFGIFWSSIHSYLHWTFTDEYAITFSAFLFVFLFFFNLDKLIEYCGHSNIFITGFTLFIIRFTALNMLNDASWLTILMEIIEPAVIGMLWLTIILYMRHVMPRKYTATGQGLAVLASFGIGKSFGAMIGLARDKKTTVADGDVIHQYLAMTACIITVIYFLVYNLMLAPRCAAKPQHAEELLSGSISHSFVGTNGATASNGLTEGHANDHIGNYSPLRVYHTERGKQGQFRY